MVYRAVINTSNFLTEGLDDEEMIQVFNDAMNSNILLNWKLGIGATLTAVTPVFIANIETWTVWMKFGATAFALLTGAAICIRAINEARKSLKSNKSE